MAGAKKASFLFYLDWQKQLEKLPLNSIGKIVLALCEYANSGKYPDFKDGALDMCFSFMADQLDRDNEKYREICRKRSEAGKEGAKQKQANANKSSKSMQKDTNQADKDTDTDNDTDNDNVFFEDVPAEIKTALLEYQEWRTSEGKGYRSRNAVKRAINKLQELAPNDYQTQNKIIYQALDGNYLQFVALLDFDKKNNQQKNSRLSVADEFARKGC